MSAIALRVLIHQGVCCSSVSVLCNCFLVVLLFLLSLLFSIFVCPVALRAQPFVYLGPRRGLSGTPSRNIHTRSWKADCPSPRAAAAAHASP